MGITEARLQTLARSFRGKLISEGEPGYDGARKVHNGLVDKRPALIARCQGAADVVDAVRFARDTELEISVKGGGHNVAGRAVCDGGLMIDLSGQKGIHVDPRSRTARAQAGLNWGEFNRETQLHGLATTGGAISTTGIAGLTLGGGIGYLMGKYGLTADNLLCAEVVTADGSVLLASADENEDLFWGLRGGGGNFGVVTSFEYQLHRVGPDITGGLIAFPFENAREVLRFFRDFTRDLPDEVVVMCGLVHAPDGSGTRLAAVVPCHCGPLAEGEKAVAPIKELGSPVMDLVGRMPYEAINAILDDAYPKGALNYWKSSFLSGLSDEAIETTIELFLKCPSPMSGVLFEHSHGAVSRVSPTATAFPHRSAGYNFMVLGQWSDPGQNEVNIAWVKEAYRSMRPHMAGRNYVNYLADDEQPSRVKEAYGPNFSRLQSIKDRYDPENVFHLNQNIPPSA